MTNVVKVESLNDEPKLFSDVEFLINNYIDHRFLVDSIYTSERYRAYLSSLSSVSDEYFYGIRINGNLVAFIHFKEMHNRIHLNNIVVKFDKSSNGYGKYLMDKLFEFADKKNKKITLHVDSRNVKCLFWYLRLGFDVKDECIKTIFYNNKTKSQEVMKDIYFEDASFLNYGFGYGFFKGAGFSDFFGKKVGFILPYYLRVLDDSISYNGSLIKKLIERYSCVPVFRGDVESFKNDKEITKSSWSTLFMEKVL